MKESVRKELCFILGIFIFAFAVRFVYLLQMRGSPFFDMPIMDAEYHDQWAQMISKGEDITEGVFFRAPLYPYFLALIYKLFGYSYFMARLIQFLIGSLSCVLVYLVGRKVFNRRIATMAGVMASLYGVLIYFDGELLLPVLEVFLDLLFVLVYLRAMEKPSYKRWLFCGLLLGLSALVRPNILLVGAAFFFWIFWEFRNQTEFKFPEVVSSPSLFYALCLAFGAILIIFPVTLRNYVKGHDFVLIASQGGMNFYIGNNAQSDGVSAILPGARSTWWGSYEDAIRIAEKTIGKSLKPSEVSRFWYKEGLKFAITQPVNFLKLMLKKFILFWNGNELSNNRDFYFFARGVPLLKPLIWRFIIYFPFGLIAPLALVGIILSHWKTTNYSVKGRRNAMVLGIFIFVYMLSIILFFVTARYRVPILPVLIIFGAYATDRLASMIKERRTLQFGKYLLIFLIISVLVNLEIPGYSTANPGQAHYTLGVAYSKKGDMTKAEEEYQKAVLYNPNLGEAYANLGAIYGDQGKHQLALEYYQKALEKGTDSAFIFYNLGIEYYNHGFLDESQKMCELSLSLRENDPKVHYLLGETFLRKRMINEAIQAYKNTVRFDPQSASAFYRLGTIYQQMGEKEEAIKNLEEFVKLGKGEPGQMENVRRLWEELKGSIPSKTEIK